MSHLQDKNSTVAVVFLLRNTLRSQQVTVEQGARQQMSQLVSGLSSVRICEDVLYMHEAILLV